MWQQLWELIQGVRDDVLAPSTLSEHEKQLRLNFLRRLLPSVIPMVLLLLVSRVLFLQVVTWRTFLIFSSTVSTVFIIYLVARTNRYHLTIITLYVLGTGMVLFNAATSPPPYYEVVYLLILPFIAAMLLSLKETIFWIVFTSIAFFAFGVVFVLPVSRNVFSDLMQQAIVFNVFILFAGYQRNRLERDRQQLALEKNRGEELQFLLNSISHDFRTPLSIINSSAYLLERTVNGEKQLAHLNKITRQTKRLDDMMRDITTLSQLGHDIADSLQFVNLQPAIEKAISNLQQVADEKNIHIQTEFAENVAPVLANHDGLIRIASNLLDNAIKYTPENGAVHIRIFEANKQVCLEIEDTGIGIKQEDLAHIFKPFFRTDRARSTYGSGLGLSLVERSVVLFGGTIVVSSEVNAGTTFHVSFPIEQSPQHN